MVVSDAWTNLMDGASSALRSSPISAPGNRADAQAPDAVTANASTGIINFMINLLQ